MRSIFAGIEYAGKSTLATMLGEYYRHRRVPIHGDDHFTLPTRRSARSRARSWSACPTTLRSVASGCRFTTT